MGSFSIFFVIISSPWSWELLHYSPYLFLLLCGISTVLYLSFLRSSKRLLYIFSLVLIPLLIIQWKTTTIIGLDYMSPSNQQLFNSRWLEMPKFQINFLNNQLTFNAAQYTENKQHYILYRLEKNLLRVIDLNSFFFANHPREIGGIREFEKFSFLLLPFFLFGLLKIIPSHLFYISISFLIPTIELSLIGQNNFLGPFILFPFFSVIITIGILETIKNIIRAKI